ncbi:Autoinducer binding domain-containing protein [Syntrophus gentianae]|uniref:Autoinducer binding domain-containing protein n=1 Tax=Syntrophus gentianae TaxID=43775 RepID=A0A1H7WHC7_9BACT|nr:Autoinducer binding domain-containing protein [Syntrophus gentianae]
MYFTREFSIKDLSKYLTKSEILDLLHICDQALSIREEDELRKLITELKKLIPFDGFSYGLGTKNRDVLYFVDVDYSLEYLERYLEKGYIHIDPILDALVEERKVIN